MSYGFTCWQAYSPNGCGNHIEFDDPFDGGDAEDRAGMAGWVIGHWDGQGHFACPDCRGSLWDARPLGHDPSTIDALTAVACAIGGFMEAQP